LADGFKRFSRKAFRDRPQLRLDHPDVLVAGEAKVDEPLPVDHLRHVFENLDAPGVVFDQIVVGGKDRSNSVLCLSRRNLDLELTNRLSVQIPLCASIGQFKKGVAVRLETIKQKQRTAKVWICNHRTGGLVAGALVPKNAQTRDGSSVTIHCHQDGVARQELR